MKITFLNIGITDNKNLDALVCEYETRIKRYTNFQIDYIIPRNISKYKADEVKRLEGELILKKITEGAKIILLDEKGKSYNSREFAYFLQDLLNYSNKDVFFITGGAYGFSDEVYSKASGKISLSEMTTTHQLIRLFFTEQLYRAFTILNNHPYHND